MANLIVGGLDDSSGQRKNAVAGDALVDASGNPISSGSGITLLGSATGVALTSTAATTLFTVPSGSSCIVTDAFIRLTAVTGFTSHGSYEIINSGDTKTYLTAQTPPGNINSVDMVWSFTRTIDRAYADLATASDVIQFNVASSSGSTTLTASVYLFGILV